MRFTWMVNVSGVALLTVLLAQSGATQQRTTESIGSASSQGSAGDDWPMYRHDLAGTGYSPLTQINTKNVANLSRVWTYRLQSDAPAAAAPGGRGGPGGVNSEVTPIVVNRVMYLPAANRVVALEPETGKEIWRYPVTGGAPSRRGVAYWPGEGGNPRIIFTAGRRLIALNANTGALDPGFGKDGEVDMVVPYNSVPLVYKNVVVVGANTPPGPSAERAILEPLMPARAPSSGSSAPCRSQVRLGTTRGRAIVGRTASASTPGRSTSRSTSSADSSTCRWRRPSAAPTAETGRAPTCSAIRSSRWMSRPARTSGISRPSITTSGTPTRPRLRHCSTSCETAAGFPRSV